MNIDHARAHRLKNQLAIILGFCELLLNDMPEDDPRRADVLHIQAAGKSALAELPTQSAHELGDQVATAKESPHAEP